MGKFNDLTGKTFGRLTVISRNLSSKNKRVMWNCSCSCGNSKVTSGLLLTSGTTSSCGCYRRYESTRRATTHGDSSSKEWFAWHNIISRCCDPENKGYKNYGGRGITVCDRWKESYETFLFDVGRSPGKGYSLDRIENDKGYEPGNCKWATRIEQANNTRQNRYITYNGKTQTLTQWCNELGLDRRLIGNRFCQGWDAHRAFTFKVNPVVKPIVSLRDADKFCLRTKYYINRVNFNKMI